MDPVVVARSILGLPNDAALQVLSLAPGMPPVTAETPVAEARRNYMRLALLLHPDKLKDRFERSTEAFQKLVRAFELVADPTHRKRLLAQQARERRAGPQGAQRVVGKRPRGEQKKKITAKEETALAVDVESDMRAGSKRSAPKKKTVKRKRPAAHDDEDEEDEDEDESTDDETDDNLDEDEEFEFGDAEPVVSTSRTPLGTRRTGGVYRDTAVACPQCRTPWVPDSKQQYTLFMGPAGKKVHCETCLCRFGCATAVHFCPHCQRGFDYDVTMYDEVIACTSCGGKFGFSYHPVNQHLIDQVRLEEWRERNEQEKAREREERANRRRQVDDGAKDEFHSLVGACIVNEMCPLCRRTVTSRHRQHIEACQKKSTGGTLVAKTVTEKPSRKKAGAPAKSSTRRPAAKKPKRRRCDDSSDSEEEDYSLSASSEND